MNVGLRCSFLICLLLWHGCSLSKLPRQDVHSLFDKIDILVCSFQLILIVITCLQCSLPYIYERSTGVKLFKSCLSMKIENHCNPLVFLCIVSRFRTHVRGVETLAYNVHNYGRDELSRLMRLSKHIEY